MGAARTRRGRSLFARTEAGEADDKSFWDFRLTLLMQITQRERGEFSSSIIRSWDRLKCTRNKHEILSRLPYFSMQINKNIRKSRRKFILGWWVGFRWRLLQRNWVWRGNVSKLLGVNFRNEIKKKWKSQDSNWIINSKLSKQIALIARDANFRSAASRRDFNQEISAPRCELNWQRNALKLKFHSMAGQFTRMPKRHFKLKQPLMRFHGV